MAAPLQYGRPELTLRRPWYVSLGAAMATGWLAVCGISALGGFVRICIDRGGEPSWVAALALLVVADLLIAMTLILEWRAVFRRSANASALVGVVLPLPTLFVVMAEAQVVFHRGKVIEIVGLGIPASSLGFCVWSHFRWAAMIANWLTRSLERMPEKG